MKTRYIKMSRLIPALGIALVAVGAIAAATYLDLERKNHSAEVSMATVGRLWRDLELCSVLKAIEEGDVSAAARRLNLNLCEDIITVNSQLASADDGDRALVRNAFAHFALIRPKSAQQLNTAIEELRADQIEAERILAQAGAGITHAHDGVAGLP